LTCEEWQAHPHNAILPLPTLKVHSMSTWKPVPTVWLLSSL
jgi:hypothetical protein